MKNEISNLTKFDYNGFEISFNLTGENAMINATEMAKPFGKRPGDYLKVPDRQEFINELKISQNDSGCFGNEGSTILNGNSDFQPVIVVNGGNNPGTWMHEDVALDFAQWLSPKFKVWCIRKLKELLKTGKVELAPKTSAEIIAEGYTLALKAVEVLKEENLRLSNTIQLQAPIVDYANNVLLSSDSLKATQLASEFGMSAIKFNKLLQHLKVHRKVNGQWVLTSQFQGFGYTKTETHNFTHTDGRPGTSTLTVWTEKGKQFLHEILKDYKPKKQA